jgi:hypothetical protein
VSTTYPSATTARGICLEVINEQRQQTKAQRPPKAARRKAGPCASVGVMMSEAIYDEQIAPLLMQAGKLCEQHGLAMVAVVEYEKEKRGETRVLPDGSGLAMEMLSMLAASGNNIDGFLINVIRFCNKNEIPLDESMFIGKYGTTKRIGG